MGTSQSSKGSPSGVPMVPSWVPDTLLDSASEKEESPVIKPNDGESQDTLAQSESRQPSPIAPAGRFRTARILLGRYAHNGGRDSMRRGLASYIRRGYGGSTNTTRRFGGTVRTAHTMYSALSGGPSNPFVAPGQPLDPLLMTGRSAEEIMDAIVEVVRPVDGTQDTEASRASIKEALSEVLTAFPEADLMKLEEDQRELAIECFIAADIFHRIELDLGKTIQEKAPDASTALGRLKEICDYITETVAASFRKLRTAGQRMASDNIAKTVQAVIRETLIIFEEYAQ